MKRLMLAVGILAILLTCRAGSAKTLEEVLKEKGVITEADVKEVTAEKPVAYQLGKGFTFTSPDQKFQLSLGGRGQFQYQYVDKDDVNGPAQDTSVWKIRRFKVSMGGYAFTQDLTYRVQVDLAKSGTPQMLDDAWINYRFVDEAQLQAGQFKMPFSRGELTSDGALQFVDRANAVDAFKPSYDIGAMVQGKTAGGKLAYGAGLFNGTGQSGTRTTNSGAWAARLVFNPFGEMRYSEADLENTPSPLLSLGADYFANTLKRNGNTTFLDTTTSTPPYAGTAGWLGKAATGTAIFDNTEKVDVGTYGFDAAFKWRGFSAQGEYFGGKAEGQTQGRTVHSRGYYGQAGYFLLPKKLELAARYSCVDPNRDISQDLQVEVTGAVSYYFQGHNLKLQGDYTNIHKQIAGKQATDDQQLRVQAQLAF
ncbi:MAG TPA: porin [Desulfobacteria bacterium]|nr:porin [Desulfobacteria bacterium]